MPINKKQTSKNKKTFIILTILGMSKKEIPWTLENWKFNYRLSTHSSVLLLRILRETRTFICAMIYIQIFTAELFIITKSRNNLNFHLLFKKMNKKQYIHTTEYYWTIKKNEVVSDTCYHMQRPQKYHAEWSESNTKDYMLYSFFYIPRKGKSREEKQVEQWWWAEWQ
jgi:hypothetical protein